MPSREEAIPCRQKLPQPLNRIAVAFVCDIQRVFHSQYDQQRHRPNQMRIADLLYRQRINASQRINRDGQTKTNVHILVEKFVISRPVKSVFTF